MNNSENLFLSGLAILFIGLKLTGFITWPWWLVLLPLYGGLIVLLVVLLVAFLVYSFKHIFSKRGKK